MAVQILENFISKYVGTLFSDGRGGLRSLGFSQSPGQDGYRRLRLFVGIWNHANSVKAERVCKHKNTPLFEARKKRRKHGTIQGGKLLADVLWSHFVGECSAEY